MERLVGERILMPRQGGGFQVPAASEPTLRDLYLWHSYLVRGAIRSMPAIAQPARLSEAIEKIEPDDDRAIVTTTTDFFLELGLSAGNEEHLAAIRSTGERLAIFRLAERRLRDRKTELKRLLMLSVSGSRIAFKEALSVYHRRRFRHLSQIVDDLRPPAPRSQTYG